MGESTVKKIVMIGVAALAMAIGATALAADGAKPAPAAVMKSKKLPPRADATPATAAAAEKEAPKTEAAKEEPKTEAKDEAKTDAAASGSDWKIEGKTCKTLSNRECQDAAESFESADGVIYAWTRVTGPKDGGEIHHVWFKGDEQVGDVALKVGGSPWRTYSKKTLGDKAAGDWRVEVRDSNGAVLETLKFTVK